MRAWKATAVTIALGAGLITATTTSASAHTVCTYTDSEPTLASGSTGIAVEQAQCEINQIHLTSIPGFPTVAVDGDYGPATAGAIRQLQTDAQIPVDGVLGPQTWGALDNFASL